MNENQIAQLALEKLQERTGITGKWKPLARGADGRIELRLDGNLRRFYAEVKTELRQHQLDQVKGQAKLHPPFIVIAEKIFPTLKEVLRKHKIGYLDGAGNIFIHTQDHYIWIDGNKVAAKKTTANRAFTKTGLKTVFYLLWKEDAINLPYRQLAKATEVALGNIKNVIEGLKDAGFILRINEKVLKIQNKKALLQRWIEGYREILKPALYTGAFVFWDKNKFTDWKTLLIQPGEGAWGGEPAAEHLTNYLTAAILTLYTDRKPLFTTRWKLIPEDPGILYIYKKFWKDEETDRERYAPPLLVYADLILTNDPRCMETAEMIYNKYLKHEIERY